MLPNEIVKAQARYDEFRANLAGEVGAAFINLCLAKTLVKTIANEATEKVLMRALSHELLFLKVLLDSKAVLSEDDFIAGVLAACQEMKLTPPTCILIENSMYRFLEIQHATDTTEKRDSSG